jgi:hypothetical protein
MAIILKVNHENQLKGSLRPENSMLYSSSIVFEQLVPYGIEPSSFAKIESIPSIKYIGINTIALCTKTEWAEGLGLTDFTSYGLVFVEKSSKNTSEI